MWEGNTTDDPKGLCVQRGWQFCTAIHDITMACSIQAPQLNLLLQGLLMGSRQVRLRPLQHRSGDDDMCNVDVPRVRQVGPRVLEGTSSGVSDGLDTEAREGDKCKTSYSHMVPHKEPSGSYFQMNQASLRNEGHTGRS